MGYFLTNIYKQSFSISKKKLYQMKQILSGVFVLLNCQKW